MNIKCPYCRSVLSIPVQHIGANGRCGSCGKVVAFKRPAPSESADPASPKPNGTSKQPRHLPKREFPVHMGVGQPPKGYHRSALDNQGEIRFTNDIIYANGFIHHPGKTLLCALLLTATTLVATYLIMGKMGLLMGVAFLLWYWLLDHKFREMEEFRINPGKCRAIFDSKNLFFSLQLLDSNWACGKLDRKEDSVAFFNYLEATYGPNFRVGTLSRIGSAAKATLLASGILIFALSLAVLMFLWL